MNVLFCILCCVLGIIDHLNAVEYYLNAQFHSNIIKVLCLMLIIVHPVILLFYYIITLLYLSYISDYDFSELISDNDYYELIYFRQKVRRSLLWLLPLTIYLTFLTYLKFFSLYSIKFLVEAPNGYTIFKNVITTSLYHAVIIQSVFQSLPQIVIQVLNNLLIMEDKHHMRGVFNFSTFFSLGFICMIIFLYIRDQERINEKSNEELKNKNFGQPGELI